MVRPELHRLLVAARHKGDMGGRVLRRFGPYGAVCQAPLHLVHEAILRQLPRLVEGGEGNLNAAPACQQADHVNTMALGQVLRNEHRQSSGTFCQPMQLCCRVAPCRFSSSSPQPVEGGAGSLDAPPACIECPSLKDLFDEKMCT